MQKAKRPCREPGCVSFAAERESFCSKHLRARPRSAKAKAWRQEYGSKRWQEARAAYLQRHPLCEQCGREGRLVLARVVDHITPHRGEMALFWDSSNWQALCEHCHNRKTAQEDGGFGNRIIAAPGEPRGGQGGQIAGG